MQIQRRPPQKGKPYVSTVRLSLQPQPSEAERVAFSTARHDTFFDVKITEVNQAGFTLRFSSRSRPTYELIEQFLLELIGSDTKIQFIRGTEVYYLQPGEL